ncbi:Catabolite control protein A [compost metagenome]
MSADSARLILQDGTPLVLFNAWNWPQDLAVGAVNPRFAQACRDAVHHLYERSCRAIYYVGSTQTRATGEERNRGYREGIAELQGLVGEGEFMTDQISISEVVKLLAERHQDDGPIGIVAFDDSIAFQFLSRLQELGYRAPQHFKIVGCNNEYLAKECFPALTTIGVPYELQARLAFRMLLQHMDPSKGLEQEYIEHFSFPLPKEQRSIDIPLQLIERLSTQ